jgi:hypothetical protein
MCDLSHLNPPPFPTDDRLDHAAGVLAKLADVESLEGWTATLRRNDLESTGVWPPRREPGDPSVFTVTVPVFRLRSGRP